MVKYSAVRRGYPKSYFRPEVSPEKWTKSYADLVSEPFSDHYGARPGRASASNSEKPYRAGRSTSQKNDFAGRGAAFYYTSWNLGDDPSYIAGKRWQGSETKLSYKEWKDFPKRAIAPSITKSNVQIGFTSNDMRSTKQMDYEPVARYTGVKMRTPIRSAELVAFTKLGTEPFHSETTNKEFQVDILKSWLC
ncbi:hypothetical protein CBR_g41725 [Chara braunii]|uniref:Uncharacterized protein n=1 Tax=Chara braunii TaxID=69332 RepID=A0A388LWM6_CHABU|nr:hypothetical protein CBR_g41725 [Chara braunii]|eukprot:GBG86663.1 hypothetical protein CBR_g41725 [Chara braunii]